MSLNVPPGSTGTDGSASCNPDELVVGGGCERDEQPRAWLVTYSSYPDTPRSWTVRLGNTGSAHDLDGDRLRALRGGLMQGSSSRRRRLRAPAAAGAVDALAFGCSFALGHGGDAPKAAPTEVATIAVVDVPPIPALAASSAPPALAKAPARRRRPKRRDDAPAAEHRTAPSPDVAVATDPPAPRPASPGPAPSPRRRSPVRTERGGGSDGDGAAPPVVTPAPAPVAPAPVAPDPGEGEEPEEEAAPEEEEG